MIIRKRRLRRLDTRCRPSSLSGPLHRGTRCFVCYEDKIFRGNVPTNNTGNDRASSVRQQKIEQNPERSRCERGGGQRQRERIDKTEEREGDFRRCKARIGKQRFDLHPRHHFIPASRRGVVRNRGTSVTLSEMESERERKRRKKKRVTE